MCPDEFGQLGSVKPPLTPTISNIFHALSKTMETSSHLVEAPVPMQLVMVFEILIWNSTVALGNRSLVTRKLCLFQSSEDLPVTTPRRWPLRFTLLRCFFLIQRESGVFPSPLSFPVFRAVGGKPPEEPSCPLESIMFFIEQFGLAGGVLLKADKRTLENW